MATTYNAKIPTSGLTVCLDAANVKSYPGSGSTWYDLSGNGNNGSIQSTSSVTHLSDYAGVFNFNGTVNSSYITVGGFDFRSVDSTVIVASRYTSSSGGRVLSGQSGNWLLGHHSSSCSEYYGEGWVRDTSINNTNWHIYCATRDHSADSTDYWEDGYKLVSGSTGGSAGPYGFGIGRYAPGNSEYSACQVGYVAAWNRVLSDDEVRDVFLSIRGRYGV